MPFPDHIVQILSEFVCLDPRVSAMEHALQGVSRDRFMLAVELLQARFPQEAPRVRDGYSGQPPGLDGVPMLVFAEWHATGRARAQQWARIPLVDWAAPTVIWPPSVLRHDVDPDLIAQGIKGAWRPLDLAQFLAQPAEYLAD